MSVIRCAPNGPLLVEGELSWEGGPQDIGKDQKMVALCRCGHSANKPYCDGAHSKAGFSDKNQSDPAKNKRSTYDGKELVVNYNKELCSHAARCVATLPEVFNPERNPWIDATKASAEEIKDTIAKCPSGALSYTFKGDETRDFGLNQEKILIAKDGPYYVEGEVALEGIDFADSVSKEHYALCRCGESGNKPFCDGCHYEKKFRAEGC